MTDAGEDDLVNMTVDVAIVNWNTSVDAITSARAYSNSAGVDTNVIIVDNASVPVQRSLLRQEETDASIVLGKENLGFGRAANRALAGGRGDFVLVSNADVAPEQDAVREMLRAFKATTDCGMVGPVFEGATNYHDELPGPATLTMRFLLGNFNRKPIPNPQPGRPREVGQVSGACFLTSRTLWESLGGFDERFFLWYEDVDLAKRLHDMDKRSVVAGSAQVKHLGGRSFIQVPEAEKQAIRLESLSLYLRLHHRLTYLLSRPVAWLATLVRASRINSFRSRP